MRIFSMPFKSAPQYSKPSLACDQSSLDQVKASQQDVRGTSTLGSNTMRQPPSVRLLPAIGVGVLAAVARQSFDAIAWRMDNTQSPYSKSNLLVPNPNMEQDYIRVLCTNEGFDINADWNTGHCMIGITSSSQDAWLVYDTSADDDFLTSGSMDTELFDWHEFTEGTSRTLPIDPKQVQQFFDSTEVFETAGDNAWSLIENCSYFAKTIWSQVTGEQITCSLPRLCTPQLLSQQLMTLNAKS